MKRTFTLVIQLLFLCVTGVQAQQDNALFSGLKARSIGPASMSGRVAAITGVNSQPEIVYVGSATGGIWKTTDGGIAWKPVFDDQPASSIGAIAIDQSTPDRVWVGTGEGNPRNSAGVGRGVFKTTDGGKTWKHLGLEKTERISRLLLDPSNPEVAYVAAMGTSWGESPERGVFKTTDGGKTWKKTLFVDNKTGAADLVMDPKNPNKLIAGMWEHRRWPWFFKSGGPGSGLYLSTDGGESWKKMTPKDGLPEGELGRIGLAIAPSNPNVVYALVEATKSQLLRSDDGGYTWKTANNDPHIAARAFYFCDIRVHPKDENTVYNIENGLNVSIDAGKNFSPFVPNYIHGDHHELWIHPDGKLMYNGNDGGVAITRNGGTSWQFVENIPVAQFYHVSVDMAHPYHVYGGLQDNGSIMGPANSLTDGAIYNYHWLTIGSGDGFAAFPDLEKPGSGYSLWQGGNLQYFDTKTGMTKLIRPDDSGVPHRFNWNSALAVDPSDPKTIYHGSQFVHKSADKGATWTIISPDLTTNDPEKQKQSETGGLTYDVTAAENNCTILCIAPSALEKGLIWVSTDDGNVQVTRDGGQHWKLLSTALNKPGKGAKYAAVPQATWSPHIEASKHAAGTAYVVFDDHRRANWTPYVFVTKDYGATWQSLATPEIDGFVHTLEEDPTDKNLLYLGTEFGLFISKNGGKNWTKFTQGFPTVPVTELIVHPRENDLVIGTHGRAIYLIDDISPLRALNAEIAAKKIYLFDVGNTYRYFQGNPTGPYRGEGDAQFKGKVRPYGALISYYLNPADSTVAKVGTKHEEKVEVQVLDGSGKLVRVLKGATSKGINRVAWNLTHKPVEYPNSRRIKMEELEIGVPIGTYTVRITSGGETATKVFEVKPDPRLPADGSGLNENTAMQVKIGEMLEKTVASSQDIRRTKDRIKLILESPAITKGDQSAIRTKAQSLTRQLTTLDEKLVPANTKQGIFDQMHILSSQQLRLIEMLNSSFEAPSPGERLIFSQLNEATPKVLSEVNAFFQREIAQFEKEAREAGFIFLSNTVNP